jgi:BlaI family transcriptional regulator, penicillinase repressor
MARKSSPALTDAEANVMAVVWRLQTATVADVVADLRNDQRPVSYSTVQTILRILEAKGYVAHEKVARAFRYSPLVDERQARRRALKHLIARLFNGSPGQLVLNVLEDEQIDRAELEQLKRLIEQA